MGRARVFSPLLFGQSNISQLTSRIRGRRSSTISPPPVHWEYLCSALGLKHAGLPPLTTINLSFGEIDLTHTYECERHKWPTTADFLELACPRCKAEKAETARAKTRRYRGKPDYGSADKRLSGGERLKRNDRIRERDGYRCRCCGIAVRRGEVDHVIPLKDGGTEADDNCQLLCSPCHAEKTRRDMGYRERTAFDADGMPIGRDW
ncbi:HNH endonuclease [Cupriavidus sp. USMAHM13]|uniref:HNH endonuclease n=1 Tax=Cupriavidus sp. USMAHM13 TaxID=1389192 RepID=UPI0009F4963F|nr:HNH endonuclease [Cupriavidus sp. USMAHM13]